MTTGDVCMIVVLVLLGLKTVLIYLAGYFYERMEQARTRVRR